ncbi:hypothetical protein NM688_g5677 [Phlebia brevispora]|uniref:Uncharacterized protein n=1 Tax=Phlebia brevispora TaxID=194682 RepID=A0ACC1SRP9_9APHY|nr:hypothetical protein NM688_g5677 [Phlebia brevispora]
MPPKRQRRASPAPQGLSAGERLKRAKLSGNDYLAWSWVGSEVTNPTQITLEHRLATCGFSDQNPYPFCANKYSAASKTRVASKQDKSKRPKVEGELEDDIIVISDDESPPCVAKSCRNNPNCLNYLGQDKWENEAKARDAFINTFDLGMDPTLDSRASNTPVGLRNLGATCYANAYLQVWFQDLPFRTGVYSCQPSEEDGSAFEDSPIFQLQVTFAAMQACTESAFNPVKLVESLKIRTTEQQDAQEFSKLFMAHLDSEFQKQTDPTLKSLIADQNNAKLEDRIAALLQPEELDGDNKYLCPRCDNLQKARRYTELRELPPVLHFSLLRFVYDLSTMERKKSKQAIAFPETLDMDRFITGSNSSGSNKYRLRGVLLHKGPSAYHGHYEAQVYDVKSEAWYQFNDEVVTKITSLGTHPKIPKENGNSRASKSQKGQKSAPAKKKANNADSDVEIIDDAGPSKSQSPPAHDENYILSREAYMLVYVRSPDKTDSTQKSINGYSLESATVPDHKSTSAHDPVPPSRAVEVVERLNVDHERRCKEYEQKKTELQERFAQVRRVVLDIYRSWSLSNNSEAHYVISRQALETWLARHLSEKGNSASDSMDIDLPIKEISNEDIACIHGQLDPNKAANMKRVKAVAVDRIKDEDACEFSPLFGSSDVCGQCVEGLFTERLYQIEHPRLVSLFDEVCQVDENEDGYWISSKWLKDWRTSKPRMHKPFQADPSPDDPDYDPQVRCEHGGLTPNALSRRRISSQAYELLRSVFPDWSTLTTDAEVCAACETLAHISKEDRREAKIQAEDEKVRHLTVHGRYLTPNVRKAKLKHMYDNALSGGTSLLEHVPCAIVPAHFVRTWKQWLIHPAEVPRPDGVDNTEFICKHGLIAIDPNSPGDLDSSVVVITRKDWETLEALYPSGPLIAIENDGSEWVHDLSVCQDCRMERKTSFDVTELTVRLLRAEDPIPTPETYNKNLPQKQQQYQTTLTTYGSRTVGNLRQSKRIRQVGAFGRRKKVAVTRTTTIKDLKIKIHAQFDIPTIYQRLYYQGHELEDNTATISSLNILANDVVELREDSEDIDLLGSDTEGGTRQTDEGQGFGGTLLGRRCSPVKQSADAIRA